MMVINDILILVCGTFQAGKGTEDRGEGRVTTYSPIKKRHS